jgi:uncharacterized protein YqgV (UPF0045/DUF77 family)
MILTAEISMYPFREDYKTPILAFIAELNKCAGLRVQTSATATTLVGEHQLVMDTLGALFVWSRETHGRAVFVTKFIPGFEPGQ